MAHASAGILFWRRQEALGIADRLEPAGWCEAMRPPYIMPHRMRRGRRGCGRFSPYDDQGVLQVPLPLPIFSAFPVPAGSPGTTLRTRRNSKSTCRGYGHRFRTGDGKIEQSCCAATKILLGRFLLQDLMDLCCKTTRIMNCCLPHFSRRTSNEEKGIGGQA